MTYICPAVHSSQYYNLIFQMTDDESKKSISMPSTERELSNIVSENEEPMIEVPLLSGS